MNIIIACLVMMPSQSGGEVGFMRMGYSPIKLHIFFRRHNTIKFLTEITFSKVARCSPFLLASYVLKSIGVTFMT